MRNAPKRARGLSGMRGAGRAAALAMLASAALLPAADSPRELVKQGNEQYRAEQFDAALEAYNHAMDLAPELPQVHFNRGDALYRKGDYDGAVSAYEQAADAARAAQDRALEAQSRFNLGNALFRQAISYQNRYPQVALDLLERATGAYKDALRIDSTHRGAMHNLEVARYAIEELRQQAAQQPQGGAQNSQQGNQSAQEKLQELAERQRQASEKREQLEQQSSPSPQQSQQLAREQQQLQRETEELARQLPQQEPARQNLEEAARQQQKAGEQLEQQQLADAGPSQSRALEELEKALQGGSAPQQPPPANAQPQQAAQLGQKTPEDILRDERANRRMRNLRIRGTAAAVEKDW